MRCVVCKVRYDVRMCVMCVVEDGGDDRSDVLQYEVY